jgi:aryl-alcohol dehydrogenase-like predicted oxidoreductase
MKSEEIPPYFHNWLSVISDFQDFCSRNGANPLAVAANFALKDSRIDGVVIGFHSASQLFELESELAVLDLPLSEYPSFGELDLGLLDPRKWPIS